MQDVDAVPATVVKLLMAEPRDVALAIRIAPSLDSEEQDGLERSRPVVESSWEALEEMFEEVGMEVINEAHQEVEDDDERRELLFPPRRLAHCSQRSPLWSKSDRH